MTTARQYQKLYVLAFGLVAAFGTLAARLVDLQIVRHEEFAKRAADNTVRAFPRPPMRGNIFDVRGNPLATSVPVKTVCVDPSILGVNRAVVAHALAPVLQTNEAWLFERMTPHKVVFNGKTNDCQYMTLKEKVSLDNWARVWQTMTNLSLGDESKLTSSQLSTNRAIRTRSVFAVDDQMRLYPSHTLAAHVLGYVGGEGEEVTGLNGIELEFNTNLCGIPGWRHTEQDKRQREIIAYRDEDIQPRDGLNVYLTLDAGLQNIVESELATNMTKLHPVSISCVMLQPATGRILAMANCPTYDPNQPGAFPPDALRNRVIADYHEPGSTFKVVVVSAALNERMVSLTDVFNCEHSHFVYAGAVLHDDKPNDDLTVQEIIMKSSNIGAAKIGIKLGQDTLFRYICNFGFGTRTGIWLPGEIRGNVPPLAKWSKISIARIPMGQGIAVTPLQMTLALSAIANKGLLMRPMIVDRLTDADGRIVHQCVPQPVRQIADHGAIEQITTALKTVVSKDGTAPKARLEHYTVAGKTGTAEKVENKHYVSDKYFSSFIGFFPADDPQLCISVFIDEPPRGDHFGGATAGPIFKAIAERAASYLNIKPDIDTTVPAAPAVATATVAHLVKNAP